MENKQQNISIHHTVGPCLVLAGPGSGKTTVITKRIRYLTEELRIPPEKILVITFTKAAAVEMRERFFRLCGSSSGVSFGTFHAIFFKIIKYAYRYEASDILTEEERVRFIREAAETLRLVGRDGNDFVTIASGEISKCKNNELSPDSFDSAIAEREDFSKLYEAFLGRLKSEGKLDFDDMMLKCLELFKHRRDILEYWQGCYEYILVDEFQDICPLQYKLVRLLASPENNIFAVGDDDQSIYSFRGAEPRMCFEFEKDYRSCREFEKISLGLNYRCAPAIVEASARLITHNKKRYKKLLESAGGAGQVVFRYFDELEAQNHYVARMLGMLAEEGVSLSDIAVLYRTNTQPRPLISLLKRENIPFAVKDLVPNIYEHWIAKNIFAYLELAEAFSNNNFGENTGLDRERAMSIINRPKRYISRDCMRAAEISLESLKRMNCAKSYVIDRLNKFGYDLSVIARLNPFAAVKYIRKAVGYEDYLKEYAADRQIDSDSLMELLDELEEAARQFDTLSAWRAYVLEYTEELKRSRQQKRAGSPEEQTDEPAVHFLTFHSAKGLEFDTVFIIDVSEDYMPYYQAQTTAQIEEERRMFYVAMTRAKCRLYLLHSAERFGREHEVSRFVREAGIKPSGQD